MEEQEPGFQILLLLAWEYSLLHWQWEESKMSLEELLVLFIVKSTDLAINLPIIFT